MLHPLKNARSLCESTSAPLPRACWGGPPTTLPVHPPPCIPPMHPRGPVLRITLPHQAPLLPPNLRSGAPWTPSSITPSAAFISTRLRLGSSAARSRAPATMSPCWPSAASRTSSTCRCGGWWGAVHTISAHPLILVVGYHKKAPKNKVLLPRERVA